LVFIVQENHLYCCLCRSSNSDHVVLWSKLYLNDENVYNVNAFDTIQGFCHTLVNSPARYYN
jgi:hypothetical protein